MRFDSILAFIDKENLWLENVLLQMNRPDFRIRPVAKPEEKEKKTRSLKRLHRYPFALSTVS